MGFFLSFCFFHPRYVKKPRYYINYWLYLLNSGGCSQHISCCVYQVKCILHAVFAFRSLVLTLNKYNLF